MSDSQVSRRAFLGSAAIGAVSAASPTVVRPARLQSARDRATTNASAELDEKVQAAMGKYGVPGAAVGVPGVAERVTVRQLLDHSAGWLGDGFENTEVRDDLELEQVLDMISAIAKIDGDPGYVRPILQSALDGLRPRRRRARAEQPWTDPRNPDGGRRVVALVPGTQPETVDMDLTSIGARICPHNADQSEEIGTWGNDR